VSIHVCCDCSDRGHSLASSSGVTSNIFRQDVCAGALEVIVVAVKGVIMRVRDTNWVSILNFAGFLQSAFCRLTWICEETFQYYFGCVTPKLTLGVSVKVAAQSANTSIVAAGQGDVQDGVPVIVDSQ
uniref:Uncharacterized protein n=1 Tax=Leptobrachium leishanense TaxID=445787 RepID=A0A8C5R562_9ANUR